MRTIVKVDIYDIGRFAVCGVCGELRGPWQDYRDVAFHQLCGCERHSGPVPERWPGFDYNTVAELCRCCALEAVKSGSRWSVWFCRPCLERVSDLNHGAGRCVVPIGRHSVMNGVFYRPEGAINPVAVSAFADQLGGFFRAVDATGGWRRRMVQANLSAIGLPTDHWPPIAVYLKRTREAGLSREAAFETLVAATGPET
jgi:hypothetical protein